MKKILNPLLFSILLLGAIALSQIALAQAPPPPPTEKGSNSNKGPGDGAPVEGGLIVSLAMAAGFGLWKWRKAVHKKKESA